MKALSTLKVVSISLLFMIARSEAQNVCIPVDITYDTLTPYDLDIDQDGIPEFQKSV